VAEVTDTQQFARTYENENFASTWWNCTMISTAC
jgi:hypothetical protein